MRTFQKYRYEFLAVVLTAALLILGFYLVMADFDANSARSALFTAFVADGVALYFIIRKLWRTKWKKIFLSSVQKIIAKIANRLAAFLEKRIRGKKVTVLSGKTTVSFDFPLQELSKKKSPKPTKWKHLKSDRERLGYLYKHVVEFNINHGLLVFSSDTPIEVKMKKEYETFENQIFDLYIENRYKDTLEIDTLTLNELKKSI